MNNNAIQMLMDAMARAGKAMPSMTPNQFDPSNDYMKGGTSGGDSPQQGAQPQGAIARMGQFMAPKTSSSMAAKGGAG